MPRQEDQRRVGALCGRECRNGVRVALAACDPRDADIARQTTEPIGHMNSGRFMPNMDEFEAGPDGGVEQWHDVIAR